MELWCTIRNYIRKKVYTMHCWYEAMIKTMLYVEIIRVYMNAFYVTHIKLVEIYIYTYLERVMRTYSSII